MGALFSVDASRRGKTAKRKGSSVDSRPRTRNKVAEERREAKVDDELRCEVRALERKRAKVSEQQRELEEEKLALEEREHKLEEQERELKEQRRKMEEQKRDLEEQLPPLRLEEEQLQLTLLPKRHRLNDVCSTREAENARRLDKLPQELWGKILDHLGENDLFPMALSCRYFRQKQKEVVARRPRLTLKTTHELMLERRRTKPVSADYLRFCSKEEGSSEKGGVKWARLCYVIRLAAYHGHLPLLQELNPRYGFYPDITKYAVEGGHLETLQWQKIGEGIELDIDIFALASKYSHFEIMKWLRSEGCPWDERACFWVAMNGHLEALKWLRSKGCPWDARVCTYAAVDGHLDVIKYAHENGCFWDEEVCSNAALFGHLDVIKYAHENGCPWDEDTCMKAAEGGNLDVLKYAHEKGFPWNEWTCRKAAEVGHLDVLKYLHENGCPWNEMTCKGAAWGGHLDVLKYAHENGCPWNEDTCKEAAREGYLDVLKYAREHGCPWNGLTWLCSEPNIRQWLEENDCPQDYIYPTDYDASDYTL